MLLLRKTRRSIVNRAVTSVPSVVRGKILDVSSIALIQLVGLLAFTIVVRGPWTAEVAPRLPLYQGLMGYFSLISFGFTYREGRERVWGNRIIPVLFLMTALPVLVYLRIGVRPITLLLMTLAIFLATTICYANLVLGEKRKYLLSLALTSAALPASMLLGDRLLALACLAVAIALYVRLWSNRASFGRYSFADGGAGLLKSLVLQSPLFLLPFLDFMVVDRIGPANYVTYVLFSKYIVGIFNFLFSYSQFKLAFAGEGADGDSLVVHLAVIIPLAIALSFAQSTWAFALAIGCLAYGTNISSLLIRRRLLSGVSARMALAGPAAIGAYYVSLRLFDGPIRAHRGIFVALMLVFIAVTSVSGLVSGASLRSVGAARPLPPTEP